MGRASGITKLVLPKLTEGDYLGNQKRTGKTGTAKRTSTSYPYAAQTKAAKAAKKPAKRGN